MKLRIGCLLVGLLSMVPSLGQFSFAQTPTQTTSALPHLVRFGGTVKDLNGNLQSGVVGITFALYSEQTGGAALWLETQNVTADSTGHYTVLLGSTKPDGLPAELFTSEQARWVGVQVSGQDEQPRVLLVSAPYALKAGDAETVGGLPPSAFMLAAPASANAPSSSGGVNPGATAGPFVFGSGTSNFVPLWTSTSILADSVLFQSGSGNTATVGINTITPAATLDVNGGVISRGALQLPSTGTATAGGGFTSQPFSLQGSAFNSSTGKAIGPVFQWQAEPSGNNTASPAGTLNLLYGNGSGSPAETGLNVASNGRITFATGQTFPGAGTITGVTTAAGSGLTGGGSSGTLNLALTNTCSANQILQWNGSAWACTTIGGGGTITGVTAGTDLTGGGTSGTVTLNLDTTKVPQLAAANTFNANQTINGAVTATTFSGNGSSLSNVTAVNSNALGGLAAGAFAQLGASSNTFTGAVTANSFSGNGAAVTNVTAVNSNELGGQAPGAYAQLGAANTFSNNQTVNGALTVSSGQNTIYAVSTSNSASAVFGNELSSTGSTVGVVGQSFSGAGTGVYGASAATSGTTYGVYGFAASNSGYGVSGNSPYIGVQGTGPNIGVQGTSGSSSQFSPFYENVGAWGDTGGSAPAIGVLGTANDSYAGYFLNSGSFPTLYIENDTGGDLFDAVIDGGQLGEAIIGDPGCNGNGVYFIAIQLAQNGLSGCNNYTLTGGSNGDTYVNAPSSAVHLRVNSVEVLEAANENVNVYGNFTVSGTKNFRIDHPLDPANKYLFHASIESSEVLNLYSGNVVLDASGEAVVQFPDWFEVINKDFRYQLTPIGAPGRDLYVAEEVSGGHFKIAGGTPGGKVSWQVSGVRNDAWEKAHPMVVEADKGSKRGQYLTPELYGAPETARIGYMAPAPGSEHFVHHRPAMLKRGNGSTLRQMPAIPLLAVPVAPKAAPVPHPIAPASRAAVNQK